MEIRINMQKEKKKNKRGMIEREIVPNWLKHRILMKMPETFHENGDLLPFMKFLCIFTE